MGYISTWIGDLVLGQVREVSDSGFVFVLRVFVNCSVLLLVSLMALQIAPVEQKTLSPKLSQLVFMILRLIFRVLSPIFQVLHRIF